MYNLIVTAEAGAWDQGRYSLDADRLGEYTATALQEHFGLPARPAFDQLISLPTLFAYEQMRGLPGRVGRVTRLRHGSGDQVPFEFKLDPAIPPIPPEQISAHAWELDIIKWEMNRTHWAVKDVDLIDALVEAAILPPTYAVPRKTAESSSSPGRVADALSRLDSEYVSRQWEAAVSRIASDPAGAITLARSLLESVLKHLLEELGAPDVPHASLPGLFKAVAKRLELAPDQQSEADFRRLLGGAATVVDATAAIRNRFGDSHGRGRNDAAAGVRHAELVVHLAGGIASFLLRTWEATAEGES